MTEIGLRQSIRLLIPGLLLIMCLDCPAWSQDRWLARLTAGPGAVWPVLPPAGVDVLQRLPDGALLAGEPEVLAIFGQAGFTVDFLTLCEPADSYFQVRVETPEDLGELTVQGRIWPLMPGSVLFCRDDGPAVWPALPPGAGLKWLKPRPYQLELLAGRELPPPVPVRAADEALVQEIVEQVSGQQLAGHVNALAGFGSRYCWESNRQQAALYLLNSFRAQFLPSRFDPFTVQSERYGLYFDTANVVATLRGRTHPEQVVLVGAHYDSINRNRALAAPGADDNASGTAGVLEAARICARYEFDKTIHFVAFAAEEIGLFGSIHFADTAAAQQMELQAVLNMDMVAYADLMPEDLDIIGNEASRWLVNLVQTESAARAGLAVRPVIDATITASDHSPFWDRGFCAVLAIEDIPLRTSHYHTTHDLPYTMNGTFHVQSVKGILASLASLAGPSGLRGDRNQDGRVDATDFILLAQILTENEAGVDDPYLDVNQDGIINMLDLLTLQRLWAD